MRTPKPRRALPYPNATQERRIFASNTMPDGSPVPEGHVYLTCKLVPVVKEEDGPPDRNLKNNQD